jgi:hypothetical protein
LQSSYQKLNHDYLNLLDLLRNKTAKKQELSRSLRSLESQLSEQVLSKSNI